MTDSIRCLNGIYRTLLAHYGPQGWWPANDPFEAAVGAVLTQGTAWTNAAKAINALKQRRSLHPGVIHRFRAPTLAAHIRPGGYHNVKAARVKALTNWWLDSGGYRGLKRLPTDVLRDSLLGVYGVGPETADVIVLYVFKRRVFVVDAYARRLFSRIGLIEGNEPYEALREFLEQGFDGGTQACNEYHALIVEHCKMRCRVKPRCGECGLSAVCACGSEFIPTCLKSG